MGTKSGSPNKRPTTPQRPKKKTWFSDDHYKWVKYSDRCPWRIFDLCKATAMMCTYTNCAPWHFLETFRKSLINNDEWSEK